MYDIVVLQLTIDLNEGGGFARCNFYLSYTILKIVFGKRGVLKYSYVYTHRSNTLRAPARAQNCHANSLLVQLTVLERLISWDAFDHFLRDSRI